MNDQDKRAIMTVALCAAFADGTNDERERKALQQVADALGRDGGIDFPALYRDVLLGKPDLMQVVAGLGSPELRTLAYEMAVGVCDADGDRAAGESEFLARLAQALQVAPAAAQAIDQQARTVSDAGATDPASPPAAAAATGTVTPAPADGTVLGRANVGNAEMDRLILNAAVTNAALELLPETLASMAIIPLQIRLVYRIGKSYGYPMDSSNAKDFIATLGVGLTSQYVEQLGRKLLGGLLGTVAGGIGRGLGHQAASSGLTFATTYAIGRVAQRYYSSGRTLDAQSLKATFASLLAEARGLAPGYRQQIEQTAGTIDVRNIAALIREI
jgi:uncharacterized protein (DUF697 family)/tellurite resistance protein